MSENSKKSKKNSPSWGIEEDYFPLNIHVAPLDAKDLEHSENLTPEQRLEWLMTMQRLLIEHFKKKS